MTTLQIKKANALLVQLDFDGCIELFEKLPYGSELEFLVMDRMEEIDYDRFIKFSEQY